MSAGIARVARSLILILLLSLSTLSVFAEDCVDYGDYLHALASIELPLDRAYKMDLAGDLAYVAHEGGLLIIDVADPAEPWILSDLAIGFCKDVDVVGDLAYLAGLDCGFHIVDISDPYAPMVLGGEYSPREYNAVTVSGDYAYLAATIDGLVIMDVHDPMAPTVAGGYDDYTWALDVQVVGNLAYVAASDDGVLIVDVTNPDATHLLTTIDAKYVYSLAVQDDILYYPDDNYHLMIHDVSDPSAPVYLADAVTFGSGFETEAVGDRLCVGGGSCIVIIDIAQPAKPDHLGTFELGSGRGIAISGDLVFLSTGDYSNFWVVDATNPASPASLGHVTPPDWSYDIEARSDYAYVASWDCGLQVLDITIPTEPTIVAACEWAASAADLRLVDNLAYVLNYDDGFKVIDISDPLAPVMIGAFVHGEGYRGMDIQGDLIYLAGISGLVIADISKPSAPVLLGGAPTEDPGTDVAVADGYAYVSDFNRMRVFDVSDPGSPLPMGSLDGWINCIHLRGQHAIVADVLHCGVIDISDPWAPAWLLRCNLPGYVEDMVMDGDVAYIADGSAGMQVIDFSDPLAPVYLGASRMEHGLHTGVAVNENYAFIANGHTGVLVLPKHCSLTAAANTAPVAELPHLRNHPNPFNPATTISFELPRAKRVTLEVFDTRGRLLRTLATGRLPAGPHEFVWDGRDAAGSAQGSGVYLSRLKTSATVVGAKMLLLK